MLYRYKVALFAGTVAAITFLVAYVTGPKAVKGPNIRVLCISFSDEEVIKRSTQNTPFNPDGSIQVLQISDDKTITIDREEWDIKSGHENFYQTNIVLECTASFPITWKYAGYGDPVVTEKNVRIHGNFNDSSTFSYLSVLNVMPLTEKSTGLYTCSGASNDTTSAFDSVHIFVPDFAGEFTFLIDYDTTIDTSGGDEIFVPCPVSNASANVSLYFKNQEIVSEDHESLLSYDPKTGFFLKPKFVEEQADPWGDYFCMNMDTKEKSGVITVQPVKGLIVNAVPESDTVFFSKADNDPNEKFKFICQAKEEITLKFLRVVSNPMVHYVYNSSATFPFSAYTEINTKILKNLSRIYCRSERTNQDLHSWKVLFSSLSIRSELLDFHYDSTREDFSCCSPSNKKAKLAFLNCDSVSECVIKSHCLRPGRRCNPDKILWLPERPGCVRHKLGTNEKSGNDNSISAFSGLLQCSIEGKSVEKVFFASRRLSGNGTQQTFVSDNIGTTPGGGWSFASTDSPNVLEIMEIRKSSNVQSRTLYRCRGVKFFLAGGFIWQTIHANNQIKYHVGRERVKGAWIMSQLSINAAFGSSKIRRIYCLAPIWNSYGKWAHVKLELY